MPTLITRTQHWPLGASEPTVSRSRAHTAALWTVSAAVAAMFLVAGWPKLAGDPYMVQTFEAIGAGQWFRYLTGAIEVVAAVTLLVPRLALFGALALAATMVGAIFSHLVVLGGSPAVPMILLVATAFIAWTRWSTR